MTVPTLHSKKAVSRERVISISFIDVFVQALFLLLLLLTVGYMDPLDRLKIAKEREAGADFCKKHFPDDPVGCQQMREKVLSEWTGKSKLNPCLTPNSNQDVPQTVEFHILGPDQVDFRGFTTDYRRYLKQTGQIGKLEKIEQVKVGVRSLEQTKKDLGFVRESSCYHRAVIPFNTPIPENISGPLRRELNVMFRADEAKK